ncbi:MAG: class I SAM-dependent methyltransferase, partial [Solirubrobacterales bacterium]
MKGRIHTLGRDQEAITHHYDVSNDFYRRMLGETMVYSCAYFGSPEDSLDE